MDSIPDSYKHDGLSNPAEYDKFKIVNKQDRPACTSKIYDPLARFQPWEWNENTMLSSHDEDASPIILGDPEIVAPYSLSFR